MNGHWCLGASRWCGARLRPASALLSDGLTGLHRLAGAEALATYQQELTATRGAGRTELIKPVSALDKNKNANVEQLHVLFTRLYEEGYTLQNSAIVGSTSNNM
ncbi:hypothetical protein AUC43_03220 [Hymenobacter sedentarius]|uniref:Uncharacterized protein n=1 Tax=Hymenobacter sedentarius TaxID=1411621 RepID=A0A0U4AKS4_9BACT|nr:hypothetical protein AUC43_03220 [Hymenobacter sedentarius]